MAKAARLCNAAASAAAGDGSSLGLRGYIGAGSLFKFYVGVQNPTSPELAPAGAALTTVTPPTQAGSYGAASNGAITAGSITNGAASSSGTAGSFWHTKADGTTPILDGTVGIGTYDIAFDNNIFVSGGVVAISSIVITVPPW